MALLDTKQTQWGVTDTIATILAIIIITTEIIAVVWKVIWMVDPHIITLTVELLPTIIPILLPLIVLIILILIIIYWQMLLLFLPHLRLIYMKIKEEIHSLKVDQIWNFLEAILQVISIQLEEPLLLLYPQLLPLLLTLHLHIHQKIILQRQS